MPCSSVSCWVVQSWTLLSLLYVLGLPDQSLLCKDPLPGCEDTQMLIVDISPDLPSVFSAWWGRMLPVPRVRGPFWSSNLCCSCKSWSIVLCDTWVTRGPAPLPLHSQKGFLLPSLLCDQTSLSFLRRQTDCWAGQAALCHLQPWPSPLACVLGAQQRVPIGRGGCSSA